MFWLMNMKQEPVDLNKRGIKMICRHCGKEYSDEFAYCPYCAEPKPAREKTLDEAYIERKVGRAKFWSIFGGVLLQIFCLIFMGPVLGLIFGILVFPVCIWAIIYGTGKRVREEIEKNSCETIIKKQFMADQTSICPNCGSHDIKVYRKGYDYGTGFWLRKHGGAFVAGMDSNTACCRCMNCGNDWETDYDYRLIK